MKFVAVFLLVTVGLVAGVSQNVNTIRTYKPKYNPYKSTRLATSSTLSIPTVVAMPSPAASKPTFRLIEAPSIPPALTPTAPTPIIAPPVFSSPVLLSPPSSSGSSVSAAASASSSSLPLTSSSSSASASASASSESESTPSSSSVSPAASDSNSSSSSVSPTKTGSSSSWTPVSSTFVSESKSGSTSSPSKPAAPLASSKPATSRSIRYPASGASLSSNSAVKTSSTSSVKDKSPIKRAPIPVKYSYAYAVKDRASNVDFGHRESRNGTNTKGRYDVVLPDGRRQIVDYYINHNFGYVADITYEGEVNSSYVPSENKNDNLSLD